MKRYTSPTAEEIEKELDSAKSMEDFFGKDGIMSRLFTKTMNRMLEAEMTNHLGYEKNDVKGNNSGNSRNGSYHKKLKSSFGESNIEVPRDRNGIFEPEILPKYQRSTTNEFDNKIIALYARGQSTRDIQSTIAEAYGVDISAEMVSRITDKIIPEVAEWQNRQLEKVYPIIYLDCIHIKIRNENKVQTRAVYNCLAITLEGKKDVLGQWVSTEAEGANFWLQVITDLQQRGVEDILIACVDGLKGFKEAIQSVFPNTQVQKCIIHQIRNSLKYISWKDQREFLRDLKPIYQAINREIAEENLEKLEEKWGSKYQLSVNSWKTNWEELATFFEFPEEIRRIIYTTNIIEGYHRQIRKVIKTKATFPTIESVEKILYMITQNAEKKWTMPVRDWGKILNQLMIKFGDRINLNF